MALSLSVDTLVVSMCGGVSLGRITAGKVLKVASAFAVMQTAFLSAGWRLLCGITPEIRGKLLFPRIMDCENFSGTDR